MAARLLRKSRAFGLGFSVGAFFGASGAALNYILI
jgi:hypothetical protein